MRRIFTSLTLVFIAVAGNATIHTVEIRNNLFTPSALSLDLGDTIRWVWMEGFHTTTSTSVPVGANSWNETMSVSNDTFTYIPTVEGQYTYECSFHSSLGMVAQFTVTDPLSVGPTPSKQVIRLRSSRVSEYLTVEMPELNEYFYPVVRDLTGRAIQSFDPIAPGTTTLYVGNLKNGIYILELSSNKMRLSYRFVKY